MLTSDRACGVAVKQRGKCQYGVSEVLGSSVVRGYEPEELDVVEQIC